MQYWLLKSEPSTYSIDDLANNDQQTDYWDGIRNYQARNFIRDQIRVGDLAFFYHSSCQTPGIVGVVRIVSDAYPDTTALDPNSQYFDAKASIDNPIWYRFDVQLVQKCSIVTLTSLKADPALTQMLILKKGNRLSITPIIELHWQHILTQYLKEEACS